MRIRSAEQYEQKKSRLKKKAKARRGKLRDAGRLVGLQVKPNGPVINVRVALNQVNPPKMDNEKRFTSISSAFEMNKAGHN